MEMTNDQVLNLLDPEFIAIVKSQNGRHFPNKEAMDKLNEVLKAKF